MHVANNQQQRKTYKVEVLRYKRGLFAGEDSIQTTFTSKRLP